MTPTPPFWFNQRQGKVEPAGTDAVRLTAPNLRPAIIRIQRGDNGQWSAELKMAEEGPNLAVAEAGFDRAEEAWEAAFELYRIHLVV